ncbi:MAG: hypothetical protein WAW11_04085 [Patescibacteria group bacterium]
MLSLTALRKSLGVTADDLSEQELIQVRHDMYQLSYLAINYYLKNIYNKQPIIK